MFDENKFLMQVRDAFDSYMLDIYPQQSLFTPTDAAVAVANFCGLSAEEATHQMRLPNHQREVNRYRILKHCERILLLQERQQRASAAPGTAQTPLFIPGIVTNNAMTAAASAPLFARPVPRPLLVGPPSAPLHQNAWAARPQMVYLVDAPHTPHQRSFTRPPASPPTAFVTRTTTARTTKSAAVERASTTTSDVDNNGGGRPADEALSLRGNSRATVNDAWRDEAVDAVSPTVLSESGIGRTRSPSPVRPTPSDTTTTTTTTHSRHSPTGSSRLDATPPPPLPTSDSAITPTCQKSAAPTSATSSALKVCRQYAHTGTCSFGCRCLYHHVSGGYSPGGLTSLASHTPTANSSIVPAHSMGSPSSYDSLRPLSGGGQHTSCDEASFPDGHRMLTTVPSAPRSPQEMALTPPRRNVICPCCGSSIDPSTCAEAVSGTRADGAFEAVASQGITDRGLPNEEVQQQEAERESNSLLPHEGDFPKPSARPHALAYARIKRAWSTAAAATHESSPASRAAPPPRQQHSMTQQ